MMPLKRIVYSSLFLISLTISAQRHTIPVFGEPSAEDFAVKTYEQNPEASGIVLYEQGNYYFEVINNSYIRLIKDVYRKIKVLNADNFKEGEIQIELYINDNTREKITKLKAVTNNGRVKTYVKEADIFELKETENFYSKRFAFPNIKDGSILEYKYTIESPFFFNLNGWYFQNNIPTLYSEFTTNIPGNFNYNRSLKGNLKLIVNDAKVKKSCFHIEGYSSADCEIAIYAMSNTPAFKKEIFMLDEKNYRAQINYELRDFLDYSGSKNFYSKTWKDVDKNFKTDKDMGRQLSYKNYFKKILPQAILAINDDLEKAKAIYSFIQDHFRWDGEYRIFSDVRVKDAFEQKTGNITEINLALINGLQAADLDAKIVLSSTRDNGVPTTIYPILTDFNYVTALLTIDNNKYLLDATSKYTPFGMIPYNVLNLQGRVMDFKKGSYWEPITPFVKNINYTNTQLTIDSEGLLKGKLNESFTGYFGIDERKRIDQSSEESYVKNKEAHNLEIEKFTIKNRNNIDESLKISYDITVTPEIIEDKLYVFPFSQNNTYLDENPFKENTRQYPIDIGFPYINTYLVSIDLNNQYEVVELPKSRVFRIPEGVGECSVNYHTENNKINVRISIKLNTYRFSPESYPILKEFFSNIIIIQSKEPIVLKKL